MQNEIITRLALILRTLKPSILPLLIISILVILIIAVIKNNSAKVILSYLGGWFSWVLAIVFYWGCTVWIADKILCLIISIAIGFGFTPIISLLIKKK